MTTLISLREHLLSVTCNARVLDVKDFTLGWVSLLATFVREESDM